MAIARAPQGAFDPIQHCLAKLRDQRLRTVDLGEGRSVQVLVLRETELAQLQRRPLVDIVCDQAVDWAGFSEAAIFGAHDGSPDPLAFDAALWAAIARDDIDVTNAVGAVLIEHADKLMEARAAAKKA